MSIEMLNLLDDDSDVLDLSASSTTSIPDNKTDIKIGNDGVWTISSLKAIKPPLVVYIPYNILYMMRCIESKMSPSALEFGAFLKGSFNNGELRLTEDFIVVKQSVSSASIDFLEDPPSGFNGVIHRHPNSCTRFSGVDDGSINENYDFSLLYVNGNITYGIINIAVPGGVKLQVELKVVIVYPISEEVDQWLNKITPKVFNNKNNIVNLLGDDDDIKKLMTENNPLNINPEFDLGDSEDQEVMVNLGYGHTFDGTYIYDREDNIIEEEDLPEKCINAYVSATLDRRF